MIRLYSIEGNSQKLDGGAMFGNAPKALWSRWIAPDEQNRIPLACRSLLVDVDGTRILFEAGIGAFFEPSLADRYGVQNPDQHLLTERLHSEFGISEDEIDLVVLSHLHFDHAGGLLPSFREAQAGRTELHFPNALYVVGEQAWLRAKHPHPRDRASFIPALTDALEASGRLRIVTTSAPGPAPLPQLVEWIQTDGHTPGQLHALIRDPSSGHAIFFCGDLIPGTAWIHVPITMGYDRNAEQVIDEKTSLLARAHHENWRLFFTHDAAFACSEIAEERGRFLHKNPVPHLAGVPL